MTHGRWIGGRCVPWAMIEGGEERIDIHSLAQRTMRLSANSRNEAVSLQRGSGAVATARDQGLPLPAATMPLSPWRDMEATSETFDTNAAKDLLVTRDIIQTMAGMFLGEGAIAETQSPTRSTLTSRASRPSISRPGLTRHCRRQPQARRARAQVWRRCGARDRAGDAARLPGSKAPHRKRTLLSVASPPGPARNSGSVDVMNLRGRVEPPQRRTRDLRGDGRRHSDLAARRFDCGQTNQTRSRASPLWNLLPAQWRGLASKAAADNHAAAVARGEMLLVALGEPALPDAAHRCGRGDTTKSPGIPLLRQELACLRHPGPASSYAVEVKPGGHRTRLSFPPNC
jgi:hypothetical protein